MSRHVTHGFTLVELMVVITIIVVLLALLAPALDQAIYQAELAVCGARVHDIGLGAQNYAFDHKRSYPRRPSLEVSRERCICIRSTFFDPSYPDDRPYLRGYIDINKHLNCPLTKAIDLENTLPDSSLFSPYALWFGTGYRVDNHATEHGMYKVGDRFTWEGQGYNVLAGDWDGVYIETNPPHHFSTHPDREGIMWDWVVQDQDFTNWWTGGPATHTPQVQTCWSYWHTNSGQSRGTLDNNYGFDDGSVRRYNNIGPYAGDPGAPRAPEGWVWVPQYGSGSNIATYKVQLPAVR